MYHILIVEDDPTLGQGLRLAFQNPHQQSTLACSCAEARQLLHTGAFDLALFDINLPDGSGLGLLCETRQNNDPPVILLTCNDLENDIVTGLSLGAEDYITKPFSLAVLRARVDAVLRRRAATTAMTTTAITAAPADMRDARDATNTRDATGTPATAFVWGGFVFDFDHWTFSVDGRPVQLSLTEQKLLRLLVENRGRTLPREFLLDRVWSDGAKFVDENALSVTIGRLRRKLGSHAPIQTVYGLGYTWAVSG